MKIHKWAKIITENSWLDLDLQHFKQTKEVNLKMISLLLALIEHFNLVTLKQGL